MSYSSCLGSFEHWENAMCIFEEMRRNEVEPNVISFNTCISILEGWQNALKLFSGCRICRIDC